MDHELHRHYLWYTCTSLGRAALKNDSESSSRMLARILTTSLHSYVNFTGCLVVFRLSLKYCFHFCVWWLQIRIIYSRIWLENKAYHLLIFVYIWNFQMGPIDHFGYYSWKRQYLQQHSWNTGVKGMIAFQCFAVQIMHCWGTSSPKA